MLWDPDISLTTDSFLDHTFLVHSSSAVTASNRITTAALPSRYYGQDDMDVPTSLGTAVHSRSSTVRTSTRRRSNSFSNLIHVNPDRDSLVPLSFTSAKKQMIDSKHTSDEYLFVQSESNHTSPVTVPVHRCPGCPGALERFAHR